MEHLHERPLCPTIEIGVAGFHFSVPVVAETNLAQLFNVASNVGHRRLFWVLPGLYGVLLSGQSVRVEAHRVEYIEALQAFVAAVYIAGDIAKRVSYMQSGSARVGEHIEYVERFFVAPVAYFVGVVLLPERLPFLLNFREIIFHIIRVSYYSVLLC